MLLMRLSDALKPDCLNQVADPQKSGNLIGGQSGNLRHHPIVQGRKRPHLNTSNLTLEFQVRGLHDARGCQQDKNTALKAALP
jgi:hypothetical protein